MTLNSRRWLYNSFIFVFIITGACLLFYLQGYRITSDWQVERTGAIQATTQPESAKVIINGEFTNRFTPTTILSLKPNDYTVELKTDGFQLWKKTLKVIPSEVTFTGAVTLWPEPQQGENIDIKNLRDSTLSPNGENLLYITNPDKSYELWLLNLKSGQSRLLSRNASSEIVSIQWSDTSREILTEEKINNTLSWRIFALETNEWEEIKLPQEILATKVHWGEEKNLLYVATASELYRIHRRTNTLKLIWREKISDFRIIDDIVFALTNSIGDATNLKLLNLSSLQTIPLENTPTLTNSVTFLSSLNGWLPLFDSDRHYLYLLHSPLSELTPIRTIPEVTTVGIGTDQTMVTTNNFEIWFYDLKKAAPEFIERLSSTLTGAINFSDKPYILFYSGTEVWVIEMDNRGEKQRWLLANYDQNVTNIYISPDSELLYVQVADTLYKVKLTNSLDSSLLPIDSPSTMIQKYLHLSNPPEE